MTIHLFVHLRCGHLTVICCVTACCCCGVDLLNVCSRAIQRRHSIPLLFDHFDFVVATFPHTRIYPVERSYRLPPHPAHLLHTYTAFFSARLFTFHFLRSAHSPLSFFRPLGPTFTFTFSSSHFLPCTAIFIFFIHFPFSFILTFCDHSPFPFLISLPPGASLRTPHKFTIFTWIALAHFILRKHTSFRFARLYARFLCAYLWFMRVASSVFVWVVLLCALLVPVNLPGIVGIACCA